jgi:hypothetical protein
VSPALLTAAAVTTALLAAAIAYRYSPARRTARRDRREAAFVAELRALNLRKTWLEVAGRLARDPNAWTVFWATHGLDQAVPGTNTDGDN